MGDGKGGKKGSLLICQRNVSPNPLHLTGREEEDRQKERDDTLWRIYVDHRGGGNELETQQQIGQYYIGQNAYIGQQ